VAYRPLPRFSQTSQPQYAAPIDWGNKLGRSVVYYQHGPTDDVFGQLLTKVTGNQRQPSPKGLLWSLSSGFPDRIESNVNVGPPLTVAFDMYHVGTFGSARTLISNGGSGSGGKGWNASLIASANTFRFTFGGVADYSASTASLVAGNFYRLTFVVSGNGGTVKYFINGVLDSSRAVGTMQTPQSRGIALGAAHNGSIWVGPLQPGTLVGNVTVLNRALTDSEVLEEYVYPWQIFRAPSRRLWVVPSGGPASYDIAGATIGEGATTGSIEAIAPTYAIAGATIGEGATTGAIDATAPAYSIAGDTVGEGSTTGGIDVTFIYSIAADTVGVGSTTGAIEATAVYSIAGATVGEGVTQGAIEVPATYFIAADTVGVGVTAGAIEAPSTFTLAGATAGEGVTTGSISIIAIYDIAGATAGEGVTTGSISLEGGSGTVWTPTHRGRFKTRRSPRYPSRW